MRPSSSAHGRASAARLAPPVPPPPPPTGEFFRAPRERSHALLLALVLLAFFAAALPQCADLSRYHGDERFYTDAALSMRESGDWLTPRFADGSARFNKPMLAYWLIGASTELFGTSPLAARLPFLLAGVVILAATARLARALFGGGLAPLFAAFLLGSSPEFLQLVTRTTPDALLAAGVALSLAGAAELAFAGRARGEGGAAELAFAGTDSGASRASRTAAWLFLGGAGVALLAKGGLGLLVPAFGLAWIAARRGRAGLRDALRPGASALFLVLALATVLPLLHAGGSAGLAKTLDDQVASRFADSIAMVADNVATYLQCVVRHLLPWSALALAALVLARRRVAAWARERRGELLFATLWYLVLLAVFAAANIQRARYLLPAYPAVAALVAGVASAGFASALGARSLRWTSIALAVVALFGAAGLAWAGARLDAASISAAFALVVATLGLALVVLRVPREDAPLGAPTAACALLLVALPLGERALRTGFDAAPAEELAQRLLELGAREKDVACVGGEAAVASQMRLLAGGALDPTWTKDASGVAGTSARFVVLAPESDETAVRAALAPRAVARVEDRGFDYAKWRASDVRTVLAAEDAPGALRARRRAFRILVLDDATR